MILHYQLSSTIYLRMIRNVKEICSAEDVEMLQSDINATVVYGSFSLMSLSQSTFVIVSRVYLHVECIRDSPEGE